VAIKQCLLGALSYNGQRCTAIKIIFVHDSKIEEFLDKFSAAVDQLKMGLPWEKDVEITPLPEPGKPDFLRELIEDALKKGAKIVNKRQGVDRTFVAPTIIYPANASMRIFTEEQFGPVVPVVSLKNVLKFLIISVLLHMVNKQPYLVSIHNTLQSTLMY